MATAEGPFADQHIQYTFSGGLPGGEIWSCSMRTAAAAVTLEQLQEAALFAGTAFKAMWETAGSVRASNPPSVTFTKTTARLIGADGIAIFVAEDTIRQSAGNAGGQGAPNQSALVATLATPKAGRTGKGRMYFPWLFPAFTEGTDKLNPTTLNPFAAAMAAMLDTHADGPGGTWGPFRIAVQSRVIGSPSVSPVTSVRIGDVMDTQRRRRNKVIETYYTQPVAPTP